MPDIMCELSWKTKQSKNGNEYQALFATLPNGEDVLITFDKKVYYILNKNSK